MANNWKTVTLRRAISVVPMTGATGHTTITVSAKKTAATDNPRMELWIGGKQYMSWVVTNTDYHDFTWNGLWKNTDTIELRFTNGDTINADLYVDNIKINGTIIESESNRANYIVGTQTLPGQELMDTISTLRFLPDTNVVQPLNRTIGYDCDNRVTSISENGNASTFAYDYSGTRVYKNENGTVTYYFGSQYEEEYKDGQPAKYISYYFANGQRIAQRTTVNGVNEVIWVHTDHLGGSVRLTDVNGDPVQSIAYDPYGQTVFYSGTKDPKYQYTGQEKDASGLLYYGARYYDPGIGRFIQADTVLDGLNRYAYCHNNPINYIDPTGNTITTSPPNYYGRADSQPTFYYTPSETPADGSSGDPAGSKVSDVSVEKNDVSADRNTAKKTDKANPGIGGTNPYAGGAPDWAGAYNPKHSTPGSPSYDVTKDQGWGKTPGDWGDSIRDVVNKGTVNVIRNTPNIFMGFLGMYYFFDGLGKIGGAVGGIVLSDGTITLDPETAAIMAAGVIEVGGGITLTGTAISNMLKNNGKSDGGRSKGDEVASEKTATDMAKQIERDLGKEARNDFHNAKIGPDRTVNELKSDAKYIYDQYGKQPPKWMQ